jgi:hypothetical protein
MAPYFGLTGGWLTFWVTVACATDMTLFGYDQGVFGMLNPHISSPESLFLQTGLLTLFQVVLSSLKISWTRLASTTTAVSSVRLLLSTISDVSSALSLPSGLENTLEERRLFWLEPRL